MHNSRINNKKQLAFEDEIDLLEYPRIIKKHKGTFFILLIFLLAVTAGVIFSSPRIYEAHSIVRIGSILDPIITASEAILIIQSQKILTATAQKLNNATLDSEQLKNMLNSDLIRIQLMPETNFIKIITCNRDPTLAMDISNAIADSFVAEGKKIFKKNERWKNEQIKIFQKQINEIFVTLNQTQKFNVLLNKKKQVEYYDAKFNNNVDNLELYSYALSQMAFLQKQLLDAENFEIYETAGLKKTPIKTNVLQRAVLICVSGLTFILFVVSFQEFWSRSLEGKSLN